MNSALVRESSHGESKSRSLGFGYEPKSVESPSVQTTRAEFLTIILDTKPDVVLNLFTTCYPLFTAVLERSEHVIAAICEKVEANLPKEPYELRQPKFIRESALKTFIPNCLSLDTIEGAALLREALERWASTHNLNQEWCLDDALQFLRTIEVADDKQIALALLPDIHFLFDVLKRAWQNVALERHLSGLYNLYQSSAGVEDRGAFSFTFKYEALEFEVSGPFYKSLSAFRAEVEDKFKALGGPKLRGARNYLDYRLSEYLGVVAKTSSELNLALPRKYRKEGDHLTWLANYQIPPSKRYRQIAREVTKDEKTVREGIQRSASLIGLTLREADKHQGRPKGSKDKKPRRRVAGRKEKVRGIGT